MRHTGDDVTGTAGVTEGSGKSEENQVAAGHKGIGQGVVIAAAFFRRNAVIGQRIATMAAKVSMGSTVWRTPAMAAILRAQSSSTRWRWP